MSCQRCGSKGCNNPDSKSCSDNCIVRLQDKIEQMKLVEKRLRLSWAEDVPEAYNDAITLAAEIASKMLLYWHKGDTPYYAYSDDVAKAILGSKKPAHYTLTG